MPQNLKSLTSLRFFAAMWVVCFHFWGNLGVALPAFVSKGYLGVEMFFVLSGFILSHVYLERFKAGTFNYGEFLWARLARIYPLHIAILIGLGILIAGVTAVGIHAGDKMIVWSSLPAQITLTQAWGFGPNGGWNHPSWSISAEWFAYLTFPAFALAACRFWTRPRLVIALASVLLIGMYVGFQAAAGFPLTRATILWGALRIVPCFGLGCAVWLVWRADIIQGRIAALALAMSSLALLIASTTIDMPDFISVLACAGIILGLGSASKSGSQILAQGPLVYLGEVSFAVYMVCIPWQLVLTEGLQKVVKINPDHMPLPVWIAMIVGVVPVAMIAHHLVERPARNLMRHVKFDEGTRIDVRARLRLPNL